MNTYEKAARVAVMAEPCQKTAVAFNSAESKVCEAFAVAKVAMGNSGNDAVRGVFHLIEWLDDRFEVAGVGGVPEASVLEEMCTSVESVVTVVHLVNQVVECTLLCAAETILNAAMDTLDSAINALGDAQQGGANGS